MKRLLKRAAEMAVASMAPFTWSLRGDPRLLVLMYHRVLPEGHPDRGTEQPGMYVSPATLVLHLEVLARQRFELVHLDDWLRAAAAGQSIPALACAITFDDGWRDNYDYAYPILRRAGAPATVYLVSDLVGTRYSFWPNTLARILASGPTASSRLPRWLQDLVQATTGGRGAAVDAAAIDAVISACKAYPDALMLDIVRPFADAGAGRDLMSWPEIQEMHSSGLIRFGSHTRRHTRLSGSTEDVLKDEILGSRDAIERHLGAPPRTFCYPNGDVTAQAAGIAKKGYEGAVTTRIGWHSPAADPYLVRRVGVHEDISNRASSFLARISGWL